MLIVQTKTVSCFLLYLSSNCGVCIIKRVRECFRFSLLLRWLRIFISLINYHTRFFELKRFKNISPVNKVS